MAVRDSAVWQASTATTPTIALQQWPLATARGVEACGVACKHVLDGRVKAWHRAEVAFRVDMEIVGMVLAGAKRLSLSTSRSYAARSRRQRSQLDQGPLVQERGRLLPARRHVHGRQRRWHRRFRRPDAAARLSR